MPHDDFEIAQLHDRVSLVERALRRHQTAPTVPRYDLTVGTPCITVLGTNVLTYSGDDTTINMPVTITTAPPNSDGFVLIIGGWYSPFGRTIFLNGAFDSHGYTGWHAPGTNPAPVIGSASTGWSVPAPWFEAWIEVFSAWRQATAGDYSIGDVLTVKNGGDDKQEVLLIALYISNSCMLSQADGDENNGNAVNYSNGIDYTAGSWPILDYNDYGLIFFPKPLDHSTCIVASIVFPVLGNHIPTPSGSSIIQYLAGANVSMSTYFVDAPAGVALNPGWDLTGATFGVSNYQLIKKP